MSENAGTKKSILYKGIITFAIGFILNMILVTFHIGGLIRELTRLTTLVGLVLIIIGAIQKLVQRSKKS